MVRPSWAIQTQLMLTISEYDGAYLRQRLLALLISCGIAAGVADAAPVRVRVLDDATGLVVAARAYLSRGAEAPLPPGLPSYDRGDERHVLLAGDVTFDLAQGTYKLRVER